MHPFPNKINIFRREFKKDWNLNEIDLTDIKVKAADCSAALLLDLYEFKTCLSSVNRSAAPRTPDFALHLIIKK